MALFADSSTANGELTHRALEITNELAASLPGIRALLDTDVRAAFEGDPAAKSIDEIILCYPGFVS